jgi:hypothetical protein
MPQKNLLYVDYDSWYLPDINMHILPTQPTDVVNGYKFSKQRVPSYQRWDVK